MPWAIPAAVIASTAASTALGAYQGIRAGKAAQKAGQQERKAWESSAKLYDWNAKLAEMQADDAIQRGAYEEARYREQVDQFIGTARATQAASGIDVNYGSAVDVQADAAFLGEIDALMLRTNAAREAWGYRVEAIDQRARGIIARASGLQAAEAGKSAARSAYWAVGGQLIGAGTSLLQARYGFKPRNAGAMTNRAVLAAGVYS